ncbi:MAG: hypothetical protein KDB27_35240, partial [Planctomycetales bacterium]|nr:hypothetical protein [Planctomycetales bacterium]
TLDRQPPTNAVERQCASREKVLNHVAVAYADSNLAQSPDPFDVVTFASTNSCPIVLMDTFHKTNGTLLDVLPLTTIRDFIQAVHMCQMQVAIAGSLNERAIEQLLPLAPDIIAVRGAACRTDRTSAIDPANTRRLFEMITQHNSDSGKRNISAKSPC